LEGVPLLIIAPPLDAAAPLFRWRDPDVSHQRNPLPHFGGGGFEAREQLARVKAWSPVGMEGWPHEVAIGTLDVWTKERIQEGLSRGHRPTRRHLMKPDAERGELELGMQDGVDVRVLEIRMTVPLPREHAMDAAKRGRVMPDASPRDGIVGRDVGLSAEHAQRVVAIGIG